MVTPQSKSLPLAQAGRTARRMGKIYPDAIPIFVHEAVLEFILDYSHRDLRREIGGFLIGGYFSERNIEFMEISDYLPASEVQSMSGSLRFTHETWSIATQQIAALHPGKRIVGWHHTHPGLGVFLSAHDLFVHQNFFSAAWQVAMVVDPKACDFAFFQWRANQVADCGFALVLSTKSHNPT